MPTAAVARMAMRCSVSTVGDEGWFPSFLPKEVERIRDPCARRMARRIERLPVQVSPIQVEPCHTNSLGPLKQTQIQWLRVLAYLIAIHRDAFEQISCTVDLWKSYIKKPMVLVGPSLGSAVAIDFAFNYSEAVEKLVLIDASVYAEGTGNMKTLPKIVAYAGASLLKSIPVRLYANYLAFNRISFSTSLDWTNVGRLHCLLPWWEDATVGFMVSGGYNVISQIKQLKQKTLIIWGEDDQIISNKFALRLHNELPNSVLHQIPNCGHLPHVEKPEFVAQLIVEFVRGDLKNQ